MALKNQRIDLSDDLRQAKSSDDKTQRALSGRQRIHLGGLCQFQTSGSRVEIELTHYENKQRSVIYASAHPHYLIVPEGLYDLHYRDIFNEIDDNSQLEIVIPGLITKFKIYAGKAAALGANPKRWISAFQQRKAIGRKAVGFGVNKTPDLIFAAPAIYAQPNPMEPGIIPDDIAVSIIIPTKIRYDLLESCLSSLAHIEQVNIEIIIIDNGATQSEMLTLLAQADSRANTRVIRHDMPFNFSRLCNLGVKEAANPFILFLNDDIEALDGHWLGEMCRHVIKPDVGIVGARLLYPSRDLQHAGLATHLIPGPGHPWRGTREDEWRSNPILSNAGAVDAVTGACLLIERDTFDKVGGFDEKNFAVTLNDVDLCLKVRRLGLKTVYAPNATLLHKESQSRAPDDRPSEQFRREQELRAFINLYPDFARNSTYYPAELRRDTETATRSFR